jgi:hypothetical protein
MPLEESMVLIIFLLFVAVFLISGVFLSLEAKRRRAGQGAIHSGQVAGYQPRIRRSNRDED